MTPRVVVLDDDRNLARMLGLLLEGEGYQVTVFNEPEPCLEHLLSNACEVALVDYDMPGINGLDLLAKLKRYRPEVVVVIITAYGTVETAVQAMKLGAYDFISKPIGKEELKLTVQNALRFSELLAENQRLKEELAKRYRFEHIVGASTPMLEVYELMRKVAGTDTTVLLVGETGTGKELVAKAIHYNSRRGSGPFVPVDCSAIPEDLVASELFGHRKGAFTGAVQDKVGKFEAAHGGTIFLDEVGEVPLDTQVKLLRVLQEKTISRVGEIKEVAVDVRIIAATNRDLEAMVEDRTFREDFYYRLDVFPIRLPPLRERPDDIPVLVRHFIQEHGPPGREIKVTPQAYQLLSSYCWPGNVRELEHVIERALILSDGGDLYPEHLPEKLQRRVRREKMDIEIPDSGISLEELERTLIAKALEKAGGNQTKAAEFLGITRHTLIYRMEKHELKEV